VGPLGAGLPGSLGHAGGRSSTPPMTRCNQFLARRLRPPAFDNARNYALAEFYGLPLPARGGARPRLVAIQQRGVSCSKWAMSTSCTKSGTARLSRRSIMCFGGARTRWGTDLDIVSSYAYRNLSRIYQGLDDKVTSKYHSDAVVGASTADIGYRNGEIRVFCG